VVASKLPNSVGNSAFGDSGTSRFLDTQDPNSRETLGYELDELQRYMGNPGDTLDEHKAFSTLKDVLALRKATSSVESPSSSQSSTRRSPADSFKPSPVQKPHTQDVFHSIVKGRKSWKTLRGGEVVWPPELEAALIEALENYQPDDSQETRTLGRFPMRNKFISDWIFEKTGKRRTAKQVGSRLQQLGDMCGGKRILKPPSSNRRQCSPPCL